MFTFKSSTCKKPLIVAPLVITTLLLGNTILPVPFARNSKSAFDDVVVIKLSSINISSNCAERVTSKSWLTVTLPVTDELPV